MGALAAIWTNISSCFLLCIALHPASANISQWPSAASIGFTNGGAREAKLVCNQWLGLDVHQMDTNDMVMSSMRMRRAGRIEVDDNDTKSPSYVLSYMHDSYDDTLPHSLHESCKELLHL